MRTETSVPSGAIPVFRNSPYTSSVIRIALIPQLCDPVITLFKNPHTGKRTVRLPNISSIFSPGRIFLSVPYSIGKYIPLSAPPSSAISILPTARSEAVSFLRMTNSVLTSPPFQSKEPTISRQSSIQYCTVLSSLSSVSARNLRSALSFPVTASVTCSAFSRSCARSKLRR